MLFFVLLYYGLKSFFASSKIAAYSATLLLATVIILIAYIVFAVYHCYFNEETLANFYIPNKSIFSILLASQMAFILPLCLYNKTTTLKIPYWIYMVVFIASVILLLCTKGRSGWFGFILAMIYVVYQKLSNPKFKKTGKYLLVPFFMFFFTMLFLYKSDSSEGRLVIYKISAGMLKDNWLLGVGQGQFKVKYNEYQAAYFSLHGIDTKEALLADNSFYAFNDFFQATIENGVVAFFALCNNNNFTH